MVAKFEPNSAVSTILGATGATKGDGQMQAPTALHVLALIAKGLSSHLNDALWNGKRNASGDTTADLFDGFDTITSNEITAGKYCSQDFADKYNEAYLLTHGGIVYNNKYDQTTVEGSNGRLTIVPLYNKMDSKFIHVTAKSNMLVGYDQMSDVESILVKEYEPFILSYIATMFFGVQFESIDYRRMKVIELAA